MTSTSFNVGIGDGSRLSSRVLRPPGGGHTDIFGGEPEPPRAGGRRPAPSVLANMAQGQGDEPAKPTNGADAPTQNGQASEPQPAPATPQVTPTAPTAPSAPSAPTEVKSESPKAVTPTETSKPDAPKRVRVPPGGFSSGLW
ncbi:skin secretory protein xP2-like [Pararge aegeria]|uniref:Jg14465 protein n=2 Tax=Pararge aegeria TaxID=116150 RepID=A0A8S4S4J1_9NEOP|nr:skin secretory protein xP2-like [Pararge aegeria]XP_039759826.1 skin secretory protein xP2-like [Pararge aegeria]XP_039759827.1 skin secretory protein xP2-like [Pararge aegeria]CAH2242895.1 jg14465 [Pararge aegeria aegeria]